MDLLDRSFVRHATREPLMPAGFARVIHAPPRDEQPESIPNEAADADPADRQWALLADAIEEAVAHGHTVIAVTSARHGEGCSTLAVGLARTLDTRGYRMAVLHGLTGHANFFDALLELQSAHDLVLVDAGPWFGPGRLRRERLARQSHGCHAAIVVRREDAPSMPGVEVALESVGVACLGEVLTFCRIPVSAAERDADEASHHHRDRPAGARDVPARAA
jgi:hypothetical protein